jgi:diguanylate cyclase (GGDEF)-like protein
MTRREFKASLKGTAAIEGIILAEHCALALLIVASAENDAEKLNGVLRGAGYAVRARWAANGDAAASALKDEPPDLIVCFAGMSTAPLAEIAVWRERLCESVPIIAIGAQINSELIAASIQVGACDLVAIDETERLTMIAARELDNLATRRMLETYRTKVQDYAARIETLVRESGDAIAYAQEGIHVTANPAYLKLFDIARQEDVEDVPVMDLFDPRDHGAVKNALRRAGQGEISTEAISVQARTATGKAFGVRVQFATHELEGNPGVEIAIRSAAVHSEARPSANGDADGLNGPDRRRRFSEQLETALAQAPDDAVALFYIEPDDFSRISTHVGPVKSEAVLRGLAELLRQALGTGDRAVCFAGIAFAALIRRPAVEDLRVWAENLRQSIAGRVFETDEQALMLTCSIGYTVLDGGIDHAEHALRRVCEACAVARQAGGNRIEGERPAALDRLDAHSDAAWAKRISKALQAGNFLLVYQPIASLQGDGAELFDVLARMLDEHRNVSRNDDFISAAERAGLMLGMDRWTLEQTLRQLGEREKTASMRLFVRLSAQSLEEQTSLAWIGQQLNAYAERSAGIKLIFQVQEPVVETHLRETKEFAAGVRKLNCGFAIERLGSGHNSLQLLEHIQLDYAKIDGSILTTLAHDSRQRDRLQDLIDKARGLGIPIIAEHVETADTMAALWHMGVSYIQGNYVQEPEVVMADTHASLD